MNKENKNMIRNTIGILLILVIVYLGRMGIAQVAKNDIQIKDIIIEQDTNKIDKQQSIKTKQDIDYTGTTQGERTFEEQLSIEPDYIYYDTNGSQTQYDTTGMQREADSVDAYMRYWYEHLDTNSDGDIDGDYYDMGCGGKVHDSIIEWLEE